MPLVRITLAEGRSPDVLRAVADAVHSALVEVAGAPADDRFQVIEVVPRGRLVFTPSYLGISHEGPVAIVQITLNAGRSVEVKKALYARIAADVHAASGIRPDDVIVNLVEVARENWSFGGGLMSYPPAE